LQWRYHPVESFERGQQASIIYRMGFSLFFFISSFADYNFDLDGQPKWVVEPQLNFVVNNMLDIVLEVRYNGYEADNTKLKGFGIATGLKVKF